MKILIYAPYFYDKSHCEFTKNKTGFGIMVREISDNVGKKCDVHILTRVITKGYENSDDHSYKIERHTLFDIIKHARISDYAYSINKFFSLKAGMRDRIREMMYVLDRGVISKTLKNIMPDIVHIHGFGRGVQECIDECTRQGIKYVVTLHGLIGLDASTNKNIYGENPECFFLQNAYRSSVPITVISSGMKRRIEAKYIGNKADNIFVVTNGIKLPVNSADRMVIVKYSTDTLISKLQKEKESGKVVLGFVGNITPNKNQIQLVRVMTELPENYVAVLPGRECDGGELRREIERRRLQDRIYLPGFVDNMDSIWNCIDLNVFLSLNDGFGIPIVEGYARGIPCVFFSDLDAAEDCYNKDCACYPNSRDDTDVAIAIKKSVKRSWDKSKITAYSDKFSIEKMVDKYVQCYAKIMEQ